jgi:hypothetical protein
MLLLQWGSCSVVGIVIVCVYVLRMAAPTHMVRHAWGPDKTVHFHIVRHFKLLVYPCASFVVYSHE